MRCAKNNFNDFALFGGQQILKEQLPVGQLYFPSWKRYEDVMRKIFDRQYYTNHGPLVQELESRLSEFLGVKHVICVTNATVGLMMAVKALSLTGKVIVPSFSFIASAQSITWAGLEPIFCDVDPDTHLTTPEYIERALCENVSAILAVNLWGGACDVTALDRVAQKYGLQLYFDSAHAFGCEIENMSIGRFGSMEVFSFHATKVLSATEGGCITTNDDLLAARLRNIRSSYGVDEIVDVPITSNGRMSEAQAAIALMSLDDFNVNVGKNTLLFERYRQVINIIPGLKVVEPKGVSKTNYQYLVCQVDESLYGLSRDELLTVLKAENINARRYFYPGIHRCPPYDTLYPHLLEVLPNTDRLCDTLFQLPIGAMVSIDTVDCIGDILSAIYFHSTAIKGALEA
ncbi:DegT/DnrJ/EryC1/StrS family aminotransferase [Alicyclobacillus tolerans]|uniref:DegT/DnrJ/EryC1/StrS family aminotransferase n=1 Tax=Alicyclobacillus tolerans TaxID=90970 RepID=UPI001F3D4106|nr:DegT/DnrJ/EryC1/StrS family aminotransferase [Alicyclobacillus tolerans]MCF8567766.1 DegT/DnrJ/EryC1/StrS family aminotransferase [Alicyclobacillus tolerans]